MCVCLVTQWCLTLYDPMDCSPPGSSVHGNSPGRNTRVDCHALLQGIFLTQGSNPGLLHYRQIIYCLSHQGGPRILEWGSLSLFQGIFPTQELNRGLLQLQVDSLPAELPGCVCMCKLSLRRLEGIIMDLQRRAVNRTSCGLGMLCASAVHWAYVSIEYCG